MAFWPVSSFIVLWVVVISLIISCFERLPIFGCVAEWLPISCPSSAIRRVISGYLSIQNSTKKKVVFILCFFSVSNSFGVMSEPHAASKDIATFLSWVSTLYMGTRRSAGAKTPIALGKTMQLWDKNTAIIVNKHTTFVITCLFM